MARTKIKLKENFKTLFFIVLMVTIGSSTILFGSPYDNNTTSPYYSIAIDTIPYAKESIRIQKKTNDQDVKLSIENGKVTELEIDGKKIPESDYDKYQDIINDNRPSGISNGQSRMFFFGDNSGENQSFEFNWGNNMFNDSIFEQFDLKGLGSLGFGPDQFQNQLKKLQEQLGSMNFNFQGMDSTSIAFPNLENLKNNPGFRMFDFNDGEWSQAPFGENSYDDESNPNSRLNKNNFTDIIGTALNKDGLLIPGQQNDVELTGKSLKINGEKQPTNIYQKYRRIFEEESGTTLQKNSKLQFKFEGKESKRKYKVY